MPTGNRIFVFTVCVNYFVFFKAIIFTVAQKKHEGFDCLDIFFDRAIDAGMSPGWAMQDSRD
ncbi:MAG: hypothetical protein ACRYGK_04345 [Janthinobacterium lividum]